MWSSFAYHEPPITQIAVLVSFLLFLNLAGFAAQRFLSAGLLGQILVGIIYGTPLAGILQDSWEDAFVAVGYVGLLLVVFEGGMSSSISNLKALLPLSTAIALTGLLAPIALSFILVPLADSAPLHAFAAGSALSSTSLGTVLAVLQPASIGFDLRKTAFGTALLSAAVLDDIVAFILVKVLTILGSSGASSSSSLGKSIGRTIGVTIGLGVALLLATKFLLRPGYIRLRAHRRWMDASWGGQGVLFLLLATLFIGMVCAAGYGGTSPLFGSYIAGLVVAYLSEVDIPADDNVELEPRQLSSGHPARRNTFPSSIPPASFAVSPSSDKTDPDLIGTFERYVAPVLMYLLLPIFFGSIGYSIPFVALWRGRVIWRGVVYAFLMLLGKVFCGSWMLVRGVKGWRAAMILGCAMISRGEIGLLIAQVARSTDEPLLDEDEFLIVVWAIVLCTIVGPAAVGWSVGRWKKGILRGGWH